MYKPNSNLKFKNTQIIALTGNIGSGKTSVLETLKSDGFFVINSDEIVKKLYLQKQKSEFYTEIMRLFKTAESKKILQKICKDVKLWDKLDDLTKKFVVPEIFNSIYDNFGKYRFIIVEIPLLFEFELEDIFDFVVIIKTNTEIAFNRISQLRNLDYEIFKKIKNRQIENIREKDFVLFNNSSKNVMYKKIKYLEKVILKRSKKI